MPRVRGFAQIFLVVSVFALFTDVAAVEHHHGNVPETLKATLASNETDELHMAKALAFQWLLAHRDTKWGWDPTTPEVIHALWSTNVSASSGYVQSIKQFEIEVLLHLCKGIPTTYLDRILQESVLAASVLCFDSTDFHGYNLLDYFDGELLRNATFSPFSRARAMYAGCMGGMEVPARLVDELLNDVATTPVLHERDTLAQLILFLTCVSRNSASPGIMEFVPLITEAVAGNLTELVSATSLNETQLTTVSLVVQALNCLRNSSASGETDEELEAQIDMLQRALLDGQKNDGSFGDSVVNTALILPGLSRSCAVDLKDQICASERSGVAFDGSDSANRVDIVFVDQDDDPRQWITVNYTVWVGLLVDTAYHKVVMLKENTTMYQMMMIAAENDGRFEFAAYQFPTGRYVHNIGGVELKHDGYHYWLLYVLPFTPDPSNPPPTSFIGTKGVDELVLEDGMNVLFWNKPI